MTVLFRCRIDQRLLQKADKVTERLGTSTPEMFRIFVAQIARTGKVPLSLDANGDEVTGPWEQRAATLETFYDKSKPW